MLAKHYPPPKYNLIIEPFAGSAAYSCYHLMKDKSKQAVLYEKDLTVVDAWSKVRFLTREEIENYPVPKIGEYTSDFLIMTCAVSNAASKCNKMKYTERMDKVFQIQKKRILRLFDIRNRIWVWSGDYSLASDIEATWFIDPPYQVLQASTTAFPNGNGYSRTCGADCIDYKKLADFCKSRKGQVIVCEKEGANWMDFQVFKTNKTSLNKKYNEVIYVAG